MVYQKLKKSAHVGIGKRIKGGIAWATLGGFVISLTACDPVPRRTLSTEEKIADLYWIYSKFGENYAPLTYKEQRFGFQYEALKAKYLEEAKNTKTNDEFYELMFRLVSEFKDAHTSAKLTNASLPDRASIAYLGFTGKRKGDHLKVTKLLPSIDPSSNYPIKVGDLITEVDGKSLKETVMKDLVPFRDLGQEETNVTYHMNRLFTRLSTQGGMPKATGVALTLERDGKKKKVSLPWVVRDLFQFQQEQDLFTKDKKTEVQASSGKKEEPNYVMFSDDLSKRVFNFQLVGMDGLPVFFQSFAKKIQKGLRSNLFEGFRVADLVNDYLPVKQGAVQESNAIKKLKEQRKVFDDPIPVSPAFATYPAYVSSHAVMDSDGKETKKKKLVGYLYVDSFSVDADDDDVIDEVKLTLKNMKNLGVKDLIIDTLNNGGGSLVLGMRLAALFSAKEIELPQMEFRLSDSWLDDFERATLPSRGSNDVEREHALRVLTTLRSEKAGGKRMSNALSAGVIAPYMIQPNEEMDEPFRIVLLINEGCASMCDIFAGMLQDNKMATVMGTRSMGAGGNVVGYQQAPNSHLDLNQTESLIVRKDGSYVENNGVTPDVEVKNFDHTDKYSEMLKAAVNFLKKES